jgi:hypothetical protein
MTYTILDYQSTTKESVEREANSTEAADIKALKEKAIANKAQAEANALAKSALLVKLGITADEAKLLLS